LDLIIYGKNPFVILKLTLISCIKQLNIQAEGVVDYLWSIHEQVKKTITNNHANYKAIIDTHFRKVLFKISDLVRKVITRDKFLMRKDNESKVKRKKDILLLDVLNDK
jgi:hypothetical protein